MELTGLCYALRMTVNSNKQPLPNVVTFLDIIKTFAVLCMVIDHIGYYFFPDFDWLRMIGRLGGAPVWFFLIGYATSRDIPNRWMIGALILVAVDFLLLGKLLAINVIATIIVTRLCIDYVMKFILRSRYLFWMSFILLVLFYIPTNMVTEYGTLAILCAAVGYIVRHKDYIMRETFLTKYDRYGAYIFMVCAITILQTSVFSFSMPQTGVLFIATAGLSYLLITMKPTTYPQIKNRTANIVLQFCGRRSLDIYVAHLVVFKIVFWVFYLIGFYR